MRITEDVRRYAEEHHLNSKEALEAGLKEQAGKFREQGGEIYVAP
jgi:phosphomethylpyrimidine synthase